MANSRQLEADLPTDLRALPDGWSYKLLGSLVDANRGISYGIVQPGSPDPQGVPIVRVNNLKQGCIITDEVLRVSADIESKYERTRLRGGEVLLTLVGTLGECAVVPEILAGWNVARAVGVIPVIEEVGAKWVYLCLQTQTIQHYIRTWATTTVQATFNLRDVAKLPIALPPKQEREAITHILGTLDDKIELNQQINRNLEAIAQAIFKSWFVDFDPVRAKMEGRQPPGIDVATAAIFPDSFENSQMGEIPKGWRVGCLGDIADNLRRGVNPEDIAPGTSYISLEHMPRRSIALAEWGDAEEVASNKFMFSQGNILFGKLRPYFHKVGVAVQDGVCSTDILVIVPKSLDWYGLVLSYVSSIEFVHYTNATSTGTRMPRTNWYDMARYEIVVPTREVAKVFNNQVLPLVQAIRANILQSCTLATIRDTLLLKLLSGEIRVKDAEKLVEAAV